MFDVVLSWVSTGRVWRKRFGSRSAALDYLLRRQEGLCRRQGLRHVRLEVVPAR